MWYGVNLEGAKYEISYISWIFFKERDFFYYFCFVLTVDKEASDGNK